jgi:recombination endonuclease VII
MPDCGETLKQGTGGAGADHCHKTGQKRAILCVPCNTKLDVIEDFLETLEPEILAVVMKSQSPWIVYLATDWASIHANIDKLKDEATSWIS